MTQARTVPLMVPADAEIIVEGFVSTEWLEPEAPFGESHGHVNPKEYNPFMEVTCITRRRDAILCSIISQVTPSESSVIKKMAYEPLYLEHLRDGIGVKSVVRVMLHEPLTATQKLTVIQMRKPSPAEVWRALMGAVAFRPAMSKIVIAVDEDIDPDNLDAVFWAMGYRSKPHRDVQIMHGMDVGHAPRHDARGSAEDSCLLWDATLKEKLPPISLPTRGIHGAGPGALGGTGAAGAGAPNAVVRLLAWRLERGAGAGGRPGHPRRILEDRRQDRPAAPPHHGDPAQHLLLR